MEKVKPIKVSDWSQKYKIALLIVIASATLYSIGLIIGKLDRIITLLDK